MADIEPPAATILPAAGRRVSNNRQTLHLIAGPALFAALVLLGGGDVAYPVRCAIGLLLWMAWWWVTTPVDLAVTGFLPLAVAALFNFVPVPRVLAAYAQDLMILLLGANLLTTVWARWGIDRRIALASLVMMGTNTQRQIMTWFVLALVLSAFLPNTIVAAAMCPIVLALLRFIGVEDLWRSRLGTAMMIAIAWGTSVGGFATPLVTYRSGGAVLTHLTWFDRAGKALGTLGAPDATQFDPALSPDGRRVAVSRVAQRNTDIWLIDAARTTRFTFDPAVDRYPRWSPDGRRLVFSSARKSIFDLYQKPSNGAGADALLFESPQTKAAASWSPDGRSLLYIAAFPHYVV